MPMCDLDKVASGKQPKPKKARTSTIKDKKRHQGEKGEQQAKVSMQEAGGFVHRLYDTKDYQDKVGFGLFEGVNLWMEQVKRALEASPVVYHRLFHCPEFAKLSDAMVDFRYVSNLMMQKQPSDFIWLWDGVTRWVEIKSTASPLGLPLGNLKEPQLLHGLDVVASGGLHYYWVIGYPAKGTPWSYWLWTPDVYTLWDRYRHCGVIPWSEIARMGMRIPYLKGEDAKWGISAVKGVTRQVSITPLEEEHTL